MKLQRKQKKNTVAVVVSVIELVAVLAMYLSIGIYLGVQIAYEEGWIKAKNAPELDMEASDELLDQWMNEYTDNFEYDDAGDEFSEEVTLTPAPEEIFYCPHCGAELWDEYAAYCDTCGLDPNAPAPTPLPELEVTQVSLSEMDEIVLANGYAQIYADSTWESSVVDQKGTHNNSASALVDGSLETSWQEGVAGDGIGESVMLDFGHDVEVMAVEMYLGNNRTDEWFYKNNVPSKVRLLCYGAQDGSGEELVVTKDTHERGATCIVMNRPVALRYLELVIDEVYEGSKYEDTCIAEIRVYGRRKVQ